MTFDLDGYLARIGFSGKAMPDLATLAALQAAQVSAIPFEALDPFLGRPVRLDIAALQEKLVRGRRGGYCFELNTLLQTALQTIGFEVTGLGARVRWMSPPEEPLGPRTHMLLKVETPEGPHLADAGFGACLLDAPLPLRTDEEFKTPLGDYRLRNENGRHSLSVRRGKAWRDLYVFDLQPQLTSDFEMGNWFMSTHPETPFSHVVIIERTVGTTRRKIVDRRYIVEGRDGIVDSERVLADAQDVSRVLDEVFGLAPPVPVAEWFSRLSA